MAKGAHPVRIPYNKLPLTYPDQVTQLRTRGLNIHSNDKLAHLLETLSYYRLSGYWHPLLEDKVNHKFYPKAEFERAFALYKFDCRLRALVLKELEKIEVAVRAKMIYIFSHAFGGFWHSDVNNFIRPNDHANTLANFNKEFRKSDELFITAFKNKYLDPLPPSWMMLEITTFGSLSMLYKNSKPRRPKRDIANFFGLDETTFESWLHTFSYIRNVCAHHSRLWNRQLQITPRVPTSPSHTWIVNPLVRNDKTFYILSMIVYLLNTIHPKSNFAKSLQKLLIEFPHTSLNAMGFPTNWMDEPLWKKAIGISPRMFNIQRKLKKYFR